MVFHQGGDFEEASKKVEVLHRIHEYLYTVSIGKAERKTRINTFGGHDGLL